MIERSTIALLTVAAAATAGPTPQFYNLGANRGPTSISDNGVVAGIDDNSGQYFYWTASGGITQIGGVHPSGYGGQASISSDGMRIGGTNINPDNDRGEAAFYDRNTGQWTNLGGIGSFSDFSTSSGWGISGDGQHVVGLGWVNAGTAHAIQWSQSTGMMADLGSTTAGSSSRANAVNEDGSIVAGWQDNEFGRVGAVWINGTQQLMTDINGNHVSEGSAISSDGQWVTGVNYTNQTYRYNTTSAVLEYIDAPDPGFFSPTTLGTGISDDGRTIVGSIRDFGPPIFGTGFVWREGLGTMTLNDFFNYSGVDFDQSLSFSMPFALSGDGLTFAGLAFSFDAGVIGYVVTIPAPASAAAIGLFGLAGLRRRR